MGIMDTINSLFGPPRIEHYQATEPVFELKDFLAGTFKAWGIIQDRRTHITKRFDVTLDVSWEGDTGTMKEHFVYYDGEVQDRVWTIRRTGDRRYKGQAGDIVGSTEGRVEGIAMRWAYAMDLVVDGKTFRINFDDWMYLMNDGVIINRSYLKKFGLTVGELTLFMQKQPD